MKPTMSQAIPAPATAMPTSDEREAERDEATARRRQTRPSRARRACTSPIRRSTRAAVTPPAIAPTPCNELSTPKKDGDRCSPWSSTAKITVSEKPTTSRQSTGRQRRSGEAAAWRTMWRAPASSSVTKWCSSRSKRGSSTLMNAAAQMTTATKLRRVEDGDGAAADRRVDPRRRRAVRSGAALRGRVWKTPFASPSRSCGTITVMKADRAEAAKRPDGAVEDARPRR